MAPRAPKTTSAVPVVNVPTELWKEVPDEHDYPAAMSYLTLTTTRALAKKLVKRLRKAPIETHKAKDLLRASRLELLPPTDASVARDLAKVQQGAQLSPVLIVRGDVFRDLPMVIADGYHRVCASYNLSENEDIPCRIIDRGTKDTLH